MTRITLPLLCTLAVGLLLPSHASAHWDVEVVDTGIGLHFEDDGVFHGGFAVDSLGQPYFAYYNSNTDRLMYAYKSGGSWSIEPVDATGADTGYESRLAIDDDGTPHVCYLVRGTVDSLRYAARIAGIWMHENPYPSELDCGTQNHISVDGLGRPKISFFDEGNHKLLYASRTTSWSAEEITGYASYGGTAVGNGKVMGTGEMVDYHRKLFAGGWGHERVENYTDETFYRFPQLVLDQSGEVHATYVRWEPYGPNWRIRYAHRLAEDDWDKSEVINTDRRVAPDLDLDSDGDPHVVYATYLVSPAHSAVLATRNLLGNWIHETVASFLNSEVTQVMIAIDRWDNVHIGIRTDNYLYYAWPTTAVPVSTGTESRGEFRIEPNPGRGGETTMLYRLPAFAQAADLSVYDVTGRLVRALRSDRSAGRSTAVQWDGRDDAGRLLPSGIYFARLRAGDFTATRKMVLVR